MRQGSCRVHQICDPQKRGVVFEGVQESCVPGPSAANVFAWKEFKSQTRGAPVKHMSPWAAVNRRWAVRKSMVEGKGGVLKCYTSFVKWYCEQKGWTAEKADNHWMRRLADRSWRRGVDPEDRRDT